MGSATAAPELEPPRKTGKLGEIVTVPATKKSPEVQARALVWHAQPGDPFSLAFRYGPVKSSTGETRGFGDSDAFLEKLVVRVTTPSGKTHTRTTAFAPAARKDQVRFWPTRTLFVDVGTQGIEVAWPNRVFVKYAEGGFARAEEGRWLVQLTAEVHVNDKQRVTLASGRVPVDARKVYASRSGLVAAAEKERIREGATNDPKAMVEAGFVANTVIELPNDNFVIRYVKPAVWAFELISVTVTPMYGVRGVEKLDISTCIAESSRVDTPDGPRPVEALQPGDEVWSWDFARRARVRATVMSSTAFAGRATVRLGKLRLTPLHPVWRHGAWRAAGDLTSEPAGEATVYALSVTAPHNYFAEGVLVHNKDRSYSDNLDDPWFFMWSPKKEWWK